MITHIEEISEVDLVACEVVLQEVPLSDSMPETDDYVAHFSGLACYALWKKQAAGGEEPQS